MLPGAATFTVPALPLTLFDVLIEVDRFNVRGGHNLVERARSHRERHGLPQFPAGACVLNDDVRHAGLIHQHVFAAFRGAYVDVDSINLKKRRIVRGVQIHRQHAGIKHGGDGQQSPILQDFRLAGDSRGFGPLAAGRFFLRADHSSEPFPFRQPIAQHCFGLLVLGIRHRSARRILQGNFPASVTDSQVVRFNT